MPNYIRVINRPYWPSEEEINKGIDIQKLEARTITQDLKTKDNTLSIWCIDNPDDAVLAMVLGANRIEDMFTLKIDEELLLSSNLEVKNEVGNTPLKDINRFHYNIKNLTYKSLADVSKIIIEALKDDNNLNSYNQKDIINIIKKALDDGRITKVNKNLQEYLQKYNAI